MFKEYFEYLKDNPENYWFKRRLYGFGWVPVRWQGWAVVLVYIALVLSLSFTVDDNSPTQEVAFTFFLPLILLTATLIRICYKKGEKPRWQWGLPDKNKNERNNY